MRLLVALDFDGVLFNSAYEAYTVCEEIAKNSHKLRQGLHFDEFMEFRSYLTDAWQFNRLYSQERKLKDFSALSEVIADADDWEFTKNFFIAREKLMSNSDWAKLMSPYPFFYQIKDIICKHPDLFSILSTRNKASIQKTLDFYNVPNILINGQESIRQFGSKLSVAQSLGWMSDDIYVTYIDDMNSHLEPFQGNVDLCIHAGWGYDASGYESFTQNQVFNVINGLVSVARGKK
jgi:hypothetical protein